MSDDKGRISAFWVCHGAIAKCSFAKTPAIMQTVSQQKYTITNPAFQKWMITDEDKDIRSLSFITCYRDPSKPIPCVPNVVWEDVYTYVTGEKRFGFLLDISKGTCQRCQGIITIQHHGQMVAATMQLLNNQQDEVSVCQFPFVDPLFKAEKTSKRPSRVSGITAKHFDKEAVGTQKMSVLKNHRIDLTATPRPDSNRDPDLISWRITREVKKKYIPYKEFVRLGQELTGFVFPEIGRYKIEAYGETPNDNSCTISFEVEENSIGKIVLKHTNNKEADEFDINAKDALAAYPPGKIEFTGVFNYDIDPKNDLWKYHWAIIEEGETEDKNTVCNNLLTCDQKNKFSFNFFNYGVYILQLFRYKPLETIPDKIQHIRIEILPNIPVSLHLNKTVFRPNESIVALVKRFYENGDGYSYIRPINSKKELGKLIWSVDDFNSKKENKEFKRFLDSKGHFIGIGPLRAPDSDSICFFIQKEGQYFLNTKTGANLMRFQFKKKTVDKQRFDVTLNYPVKSHCKEGGVYSENKCIVFVNEELKLAVQDYKISDVWESERDAIKWGIYNEEKKEIVRNACMEPLTMLGINAKKMEGDGIQLTFQRTGEYYVQPYLSSLETVKDNKIGTLIQQIQVVTPTMENAFWIFNTGERIFGKAGVNQLIHYVIEAPIFAGRCCSIAIWVGEQGMTTFNVAKCKILDVLHGNTFDNEGNLVEAYTFSKEKYELATKQIFPDNGAPVPLFFTIQKKGGFNFQPKNMPEVVYEGESYLYPFGNSVLIANESLFHSFIFNDPGKNRPRLTPIRYGKEITMTVQTLNMKEETLVFELYLDTCSGATPIETHEAIVDASGVAECNITLKKEWSGEPENTPSASTEEPVLIEEDASAYQESVENEDPKFAVEQPPKILKKLYARVKTKSTNKYFENKKQYINSENGYIYVEMTEEETSDKTEVLDGLAVVEWTDHSQRKKYCPRCGELTVEEFKQLFPNLSRLFSDKNNPESIRTTSVEDFVKELNKQFQEFGITNCNRKIMYLTFCYSETNFTTLKENLYYTTETGLIANFGGRPDVKENPKSYLENPEKLGNYVYGKTMSEKRKLGLGNENDNGDGYKYRGHGLIQITGKAAYKELQKYLDKKLGDAAPNVLDDPTKMVEKLDILILSTMWYWCHYKTISLNLLADKGNIGDIMRKVGGNHTKLDERIKCYNGLKKKYSLTQCPFHLNSKECVEYHIYASGEIKKIVPENYDTLIDTPKEPFDFHYYYHDDEGMKCFLGTFVVFRTNNRESRDKIASGTRLLLNMPRDFNKTFGKTYIGYNTTFQEPQKNPFRDYISPDAFASFLGALAECSYGDFAFNGCTCQYGIGIPSRSHYTGYNIDMQYLRSRGKGSLHINTSEGWDDLDLARQNAFHAALIKFGYSKFLVLASEDNMKKFDGFGSSVKSYEDHHHHLHIEGFNEKKVVIEKRK
ncbi:PAAR-like protein [Bacteroides sp. 224]|uniref:PAAR-like protein n=1 Tax=Bacteroides sp. 224 TaxID=2302936 RepID=UPI0013D2A7E7|nr:PAAR-like protein [Bacteroides sp. 224]NDV65323.1 DUF4280 domain-containing protein [Bacteroides sp. 224]